MNKLGRTLDEVSTATRVGRKELTRCYKILKKELGIRLRVNHPRDFIGGFVLNLGCLQFLEELTKSLTKPRG